MTAAPTPLPLPDPPLAGDRFHLRPWVPADAPALAAAWVDPEVARWTGVSGTVATLEVAAHCGAVARPQPRRSALSRSPARER